MPETYEPIATSSPTTNPTTIVFSSIPNTYTDLVLVTTTKASSGVDLWIRLNSDTGTNYSYFVLTGDGSAASVARASNSSSGLLTDYSGAPGSNNNNITITHFMNYSNTTTYKTVLSRANNAAGGVDLVSTLWRSTAAIDSLTLRFTTAATFSSGTVATLYGIKAA